VVGSLLPADELYHAADCEKHLQRKRQVPIDHPSRILIQVCPSINLCRHGHAHKMVEIGLRLQMSSEKD
jgi:hypothetical protein